jgi:hypothetical protein
MEQFDDNMGSAEWSLDEEQMNRLTTVSAVEPGYPYDFIENLKRQ